MKKQHVKLKSKDLLSDERSELLDSFRHSGFSVDPSVTVWPQDTEGLERLCRLCLFLLIRDSHT